MLNFVKRGKGKKTVVLLHGWGGAWQSWAPIIERLQNKFTVYALDLPGFGLSPLSKPYSLIDYVGDIEEFLIKHKIKKPILVGHSFGGQIAAKVAIEKGKMLSGVVLVDAAVSRRNDISMKLNILLAQAGRLVLEKPGLYPMLRRLFYRLRGMENSDYYNLSYNSHLQKTASKIFREDLIADLSKIKVPTLLIWGERDPLEMTSVEIGKLANEHIKGSKLVVIPNAGHFSYLEEQEKFCLALTDFIKDL